MFRTALVDSHFKEPLFIVSDIGTEDAQTPDAYKKQRKFRLLK